MVARDDGRIWFTSVRITPPAEVMAKIWSSSATESAPMSLPRFGLYLKVITPMPPRPCALYSSMAVRLP